MLVRSRPHLYLFLKVLSASIASVAWLKGRLPERINSSKIWQIRDCLLDQNMGYVYSLSIRENRTHLGIKLIDREE